jgi:Chalcone isomerase-like
MCRLLWAALIFCAGLAQAAPDSPPEFRARVQEAQWAGSGVMRFWGLEIYQAELWVTPGFKPDDYARHALALQLTYRRSFSAADIAKHSLQEMQRGRTMDRQLSQVWEEQLRTVLPDVRAGDRITGIHMPGQGASFWLNGQWRGDIRDTDFSERFFGIWLAASTSEPGLRQALLGKAPS